MQEIVTDINEPTSPAEPLVPQPVPMPNDPPWNSGVAVGAWLASVALILFIPLIFLLPYIISMNGRFANNGELGEFLKSDPTAIILQISALIPAHVITILLAWLIVTRMRTFPFLQTLGWRQGGMTLWHYAAIAGGFFLLAFIVGNVFPEQENDLLRVLQSSRAAAYLVAIMATFTAPIVEEVIYRGILYSAFQRTFGVVLATIFVTLLFALVHVPQYYPSYSTIFLLTILSLTLTLVRVRTGNLLPCVLLHTLFNAMQSVVILFQPYLEKTPPNDAVTALFHLIK